jgi:hypothetical protein
MNFCPNCGVRFNEQDKFCSSCGNIRPLSNQSPITDRASENEVVQSNILKSIENDPDYIEYFYDDAKCYYKGETKEDKPHGEGKLYKIYVTTDNIQTAYIYYEGYWKNGSPNGYGKEFYYDGSLGYSGLWKNGKYEGEGKWYSGYYGLVEANFQNGSIAEGFTKNYYHDNKTIRIYGFLKGETWTNARWYNRDGTLSYQGGISEGLDIFDDNKYDGYGIKYKDDGTKISGFWKKDELIRAMDINEVSSILSIDEDDDEMNSTDEDSIDDPLGLRENEVDRNDPLGLRN